MSKDKSPETRASYSPIMSASSTYHEEYGAECSPVQWEQETSVVDRMNFAAVYGFLSPRQAAAVETAIQMARFSEDPIPPLAVGFQADILFDDPAFRPELAE